MVWYGLLQAVEVSIKEKNTSGQGRAVAWDGVTQGGKDLEHQVGDERAGGRRWVPHGAV